jgi:hypothetical protein
MALNNVTGLWEGYYKYGKGYSRKDRNKRFPFTINIKSHGDTLRGTCKDELVKRFFDEPATIEGLLHGKKLQFVKKYLYAVLSDENGNDIVEKSRPSHEIYYEGFLQRKLFSDQYYFAGTWTINSSYIDANGNIRGINLRGTWKMQRH